MTVRVKICGLSTPDTAAAALVGGAAYFGYVFYPPSPRNVSFEQAASINRALGMDDRTRSRGRLVGVMVAPDDALAGGAAGLECDVLQLHGDVSPERCAHLKRLSGCEIWRAIPVKTRADLSVVARYRGAADRILYDAKTPEGALPGGMGMRFDWRLLAGFDHPLPWALSGGLDAGNVAEAVRITGATLVDVSSGVESAPGVKDVDKIAAFLQAVARL